MANNDFSPKDPEAIAHIELLQGIINRMAGNSANCKTWAVTLIVAVFALSDTEGWTRFYICLGATLIFFFLDCFYLGLERRFVSLQRIFVRKMYGESIKKEELDTIGIDVSSIKPFKIEESTWQNQLKGLLRGMCSISTTPFYFILGLLPLIFVSVRGDDTQARPDSINIIYPQTVDVSPANISIDQTKEGLIHHDQQCKPASEHE